MAYEVFLSQKAERDIEETLGWFIDRAASPAARRWLSQLTGCVARLESHPERHPLAPEAAEVGVEIRQMLFGRKRGKYRLIFQIRDRSVFVLRIRHGARDAIRRDEL